MTNQTNEYFDATRLIPLKNGRRIKKVAHFLDNRLLPSIKNNVRSHRGRNAYTELPIELLEDYLLWLTPKTRTAVLQGVELHLIVNHIEDYW